MEKQVVDLKGGIFQNLQGVIKIIDELRDCGIEKDVKLPKIVVIGTQSSGKSSLLEQIVGLDFLPRGSGVVTRIPLEIRLIHVKTNPDDNFVPYAYFGAEKDKTYKNFSKDVKKRIEELTDTRAGKKKNIVDDPIILTIFSATCPNLTLIDLPGITRVPLENSEQPENIEQITKDITKRYIKDKMGIILCVIPINQDLSVSEALSLAKEYDKEGNRTFGVLTKIDIMDQGTTCIGVLNNKVIKLKHGYVGVKCRSQKDIEANMTVEQALEEEKEFFKANKIYSNLSNVVGTRTLSFKLSALLESHIRENLPQIIEDISEKIKENKDTLRSLGECVPKDEAGKRQLLYKKTVEISQLYNDIMTDSSSGLKLPPNLKKKPIGNQFFIQQYSLFPKQFNPITHKILKSYKLKTVEQDLSDFEHSVPGFLPIIALKSKIRENVPKYEEPSLLLVENILEYIKKVINFCVKQCTTGSSLLCDEINGLVNIILAKHYTFTQELIKNIYESECTFQFSRNSNFFEDEDRIKSLHVKNLSNVTIFQYLLNTNQFSAWSVFDLVSKAKQLEKERYLNENEERKVILNQQPLQGGLFGNAPQVKTQSQAVQPAEQMKETDTKTKIEIIMYSYRYYKYMSNLKVQLSEQIPKIIETFLVRKFATNLQIDVFNMVNSTQSFDLLSEDADTIDRRNQATLSLSQLEKASLNMTRIMGHIDSTQSRSFNSPSMGINLSLEDDEEVAEADEDGEEEEESEEYDDLGNDI